MVLKDHPDMTSAVYFGHKASKKVGGGVAQWLALDFGPRGPWFEPRPVHISLWP